MWLSERVQSEYSFMGVTHGKKNQNPPLSNINIITYINVFYQHSLMLHSANELHSANTAWLILIFSKRLVIPLLKK